MKVYNSDEFYKNLRRIRASFIWDFRAMAREEMSRTTNSEQLMEKSKRQWKVIFDMIRKNLRENPYPRTATEAKEMFAAIKEKEKQNATT